jgi:hypothetical protein
LLTINDGEPAVGREAITEAARSFMVAFPDAQGLMDELRAGDDGIECHWTFVGTNTGRGGTATASASAGSRSRRSAAMG